MDAKMKMDKPYIPGIAIAGAILALSYVPTTIISDHVIGDWNPNGIMLFASKKIGAPHGGILESIPSLGPTAPRSGPMERQRKLPRDHRAMNTDAMGVHQPDQPGKDGKASLKAVAAGDNNAQPSGIPPVALPLGEHTPKAKDPAIAAAAAGRSQRDIAAMGADDGPIGNNIVDIQQEQQEQQEQQQPQAQAAANAGFFVGVGDLGAAPITNIHVDVPSPEEIEAVAAAEVKRTMQEWKDAKMAAHGDGLPGAAGYAHVPPAPILTSRRFSTTGVPGKFYMKREDAANLRTSKEGKPFFDVHPDWAQYNAVPVDVDSNAPLRRCYSVPMYFRRMSQPGSQGPAPARPSCRHTAARSRRRYNSRGGLSRRRHSTPRSRRHYNPRGGRVDGEQAPVGEVKLLTKARSRVYRSFEGKPLDRRASARPGNDFYMKNQPLNSVRQVLLNPTPPPHTGRQASLSRGGVPNDPGLMRVHG